MKETGTHSCCPKGYQTFKPFATLERNNKIKRITVSNIFIHICIVYTYYVGLVRLTTIRATSTWKQMESEQASREGLRRTDLIK